MTVNQSNGGSETKAQTISDRSALRRLYDLPKERALGKQLSALDSHSRHFIGLSPFVVLSTAGANGLQDASPRGGAPGFVQVNAQGQLLIADWPGNNRLDTLENLLDNPAIGLLFLIPGVDETLRVNGTAKLSLVEQDLLACVAQNKQPKLVIKVQVLEAYLHCAKALMRSSLWDIKQQVQRSALPSMNQMIADQTVTPVLDETQEQMRARYRSVLY